LELAQADWQAEQKVETIVSHKGVPTNKSDMEFEIKWVGYDATYNTFLSWSQVNQLAALDDYIKTHIMEYPDLNLLQQRTSGRQRKLKVIDSFQSVLSKIYF